MSEPDDGTDVGGKRGPESKVSRLIDRYGIEGFGAELERRWTAPEPERSSLRDLAAAFNRRLLRAALAAEDERLLDGEAENLYRLLTEEDVSSGERTRAVHRLRRAGVDVDRLESDFVSHRAVHTYLRNHRGVTPPSGSNVDGVAGRDRTLRRLKGRVERVTERTLDGLDDDELVLGESDPEVYVDVQVHCPDCDSQYSVHELLSRGGCDCRDR